MITKQIKDIDLGQICDSGQCFRMYRIAEAVEHITGMAEEYEVYALDKYLRVGQDVITDGNGPHTLVFACDAKEYEDFWASYFDIDNDEYAHIKELVCSDQEDQFLNSAIKTGWGIRILRQDLWEMIVTFLISQQNNIPRIHKCIDNICRRYGEPLRTECITEGEAMFSFPTPESLSGLEEDALMECNLGYRSKYVVRCAREITEGKVDLDQIRQMNYQDAREALLKLYGVGAKVADCICLFALHHMEAFPVDTHIKQVLEREYNSDDFPFDLYKGYEGVVQQYIFYAELQNNRK